MGSADLPEFAAPGVENYFLYRVMLQHFSCPISGLSKFYCITLFVVRHANIRTTFLRHHQGLAGRSKTTMPRSFADTRRA
jgi:hypothetical protein